MVAASTDDAETRTYSFYRGSSASVLGSDTKFSTSTEVLNEYSDETENNLSVRSDDPDLSGLIGSFASLRREIAILKIFRSTLQVPLFRCCVQSRITNLAEFEIENSGTKLAPEISSLK